MFIKAMNVVKYHSILGRANYLQYTSLARTTQAHLSPTIENGIYVGYREMISRRAAILFTFDTLEL